MTDSTSTMAPGEGERNAQRGYVQQYRSGAAAIYDALDKDQLNWIGVADRSAGIADDIVLGLPGKVVGHQFKTSAYAKVFEIEALLLGAEAMLLKLVKAWTSLRESHEEPLTEVRFVTNDIPSQANRDHLLGDRDDHSAAFLQEFELHHHRTLEEWKATRWQPFIDKLHAASGLPDEHFEAFLQSVRFLTGSASDFILSHRLRPEIHNLVEQIAEKLPSLVADKRNKDRWSRAELLAELGWSDRFKVHRAHQFPIGEHVQRNRVTEQHILNSIDQHTHGYLALVGQPGTGKSTLLQSTLSAGPTLQLVRYLAYMPGEGQGIGRAEAEDFLDDISTQLRQIGLQGRRVRNSNLQEKQQEFEYLLHQAGNRFSDHGIRTLIIVDGLDHVPREEQPSRSLLAELPLPEALPQGVLILLGTQRLELEGLKPQVRLQAGHVDRTTSIAPLSEDSITQLALELGLDESIPRSSVYALCQGHPLVARYLIESLRKAEPATQEALLSGAFTFEGNIERVYQSAWREIADDPDARKVIDFIAHAEGPIPPELLAMATSEQAVETALRATSHLLNQTTHGWSVFHNSFRLFVLEQPSLRFGKPNLDYRPAIYRRLAELTHAAEPNNPQRWLELRYLARAEQHRQVLALAQPSRFRDQLADARPATDIHADIRLALICAKHEPDISAVFRLLLARDEVGRRASAIEEAPAIMDALLALGDLDGVRTMAEGSIGDHYKAIDALLANDDFDGAKAIFDDIDPFSQDSQPTPHHSELPNWSQRAFHFRDPEQIDACLARLAVGDNGDRLDAEEIASLRCSIARAAILARPDSNPLQVAKELGVEEEYLPYLLIEAAECAYAQEQLDNARALIQSAHEHPAFGTIANGTRRQLASLCLQAGNRDLASNIFQDLKPPSVAMMDDAIGLENAHHIIHAAIQHATLAAALRLPVPVTEASKSRLLRPLQYHANTIGTLLGRAQSGQETAPGEVSQAARGMLSFLDNASAKEGSEFYSAHQLRDLDPVLSRMVVRIASMSGEQEFTAVVELFDASFIDRIAKNKLSIPSRRAVIEEVYRSDGNATAAFGRLEELLGKVHGNTPQEHIDLIAGIAKAFAEMGNPKRARELLVQLHSNTLGYALPAKKDPQYSLWGDLLESSNSQDPAGSGERILLMLKQLSGMALTEGDGAAHRLAPRVVVEAALHSPALGYQAVRLLTSKGLLSWDCAINALMIGVVRRRPELASACSVTWRFLALPFYAEPFYSEGQTGQFVLKSLAAASIEEVNTVIDVLRDGIEIHSTTSSRTRLLECLATGLSQRGLSSERVNEALCRWRSETPTPEDRGTPGTYDEIASLSLLEDALNSTAQPSYDAASAFSRLLGTATLEEATAFFDRWPIVQRDYRARYTLIDRAIAEDDRKLARDLINSRHADEDERSGWSYWQGAAKLKYFKALIALDGPEVHHAAYMDLVDELVTSPGNSSPILFDTLDVFTTICAEPDWTAIWDILADQLATTREHTVAEFEFTEDAPEDDSDLIAKVFLWAFELSAIELTQLARAGALQLTTVHLGRESFTRLVSKLLLNGDSDEPVEALQLLFRDEETCAADWIGRVLPLANAKDYAVASFAGSLLDRWGCEWSISMQELPFHYHFRMATNGGESSASRLTNPSSGAMLVNDPLGWTELFTSQIRDLAGTGIPETTIRYRCASLIESWGGLERFGQSETQRRLSELERLSLRITYSKPHIVAALRALRHVCGEFRLSGLLEPRAIPQLLYGMNYQVDSPPLKGPTARPAFITRPTAHRDAGSQSGEAKWLDEIELDLSPMIDGGDSVIAEITHFHRRLIRQNFEMTRARAPFYVEQSSWASTGYPLPEAWWIDGVCAPDCQSDNIVRRLSLCEIPTYPDDVLLICPEWLNHLEWQHDPNNWLHYLDSNGTCVARLIWWRDGAPQDVDQDQFWGEGVALVTTREGRSTLEQVAGPLNIGVHSHRSADGTKSSKRHISRVEQ
ncbi:ATP-binding protein [Pseudomonas sp.]|uniref:AAA family ATPase n=1 Tax=Pseudomonas sp. TaxID=306 RepID=UPI002356AF62|nr:ATP-binding protein [Pseudomonas sp.]